MLKLQFVVHQQSLNKFASFNSRFYRTKLQLTEAMELSSAIVNVFRACLYDQWMALHCVTWEMKIKLISQRDISSRNLGYSTRLDPHTLEAILINLLAISTFLGVFVVERKEKYKDVVGKYWFGSKFFPLHRSFPQLTFLLSPFSLTLMKSGVEKSPSILIRRMSYASPTPYGHSSQLIRRPRAFQPWSISQTKIRSLAIKIIEHLHSMEIPTRECCCDGRPTVRCSAMYSHGIHVMFCCDCASRQRIMMLRVWSNMTTEWSFASSRENNSECVMRRSTRQHDVKPLPFESRMKYMDLWFFYEKRSRGRRGKFGVTYGQWFGSLSGFH